ncbi:MAG: hypothetical protein AAF399_10385 [Bacteroidota bacterium]
MRLYIPPTLPAKESQLIGDILLAQADAQAERELVFAPIKQAPKQAVWFSYINNPDGSIRWFWPKKQRFPAHLGLYNSATWKAKLYRAVTQCLFPLGLSGQLAAGQFAVEGLQIPLQEALNSVPNDGYGVFTGTHGKNRKTIVAISHKRTITHFLKLAHTKRGKALLEQERNSLLQLRPLQVNGLVLPEVQTSEQSHALILSNIRPPRAATPSQLTAAHIQAMWGWYQPTHQLIRLGDWPGYQQIGQVIQELALQQALDPSLDPTQVDLLLQYLREGFHSLDPDSVVPMAMAHGDFTPWNQYHSAEAIHLYDWELSQPSAPMLYDAFHFVYQSGILLLQATETELAAHLSTALELPAMQALIQRYQLPIEPLHLLYLLQVTSYYLPIYFAAPQVHLQVHWLLRHWTHALEHCLSSHPTLTPTH